jgi:predicted HicB family RNase H-like nuclease
MAERKQRTTTAIRFPPPLHDQLKAAAEEREMSINFLVVKACEEFVDKLLPADEIRYTRSA